MPLKTVRTFKELRRQIVKWQSAGQAVALVPTMGALHEGHLDLVRVGRKKADRVVATIFVNPRQFAAHEDLSKYPRTETEDKKLLLGAGCDLVFIPEPQEIYPPHFASQIHMEGPAKAGLEDAFRPHFFDGVATIVAKLFIGSGANFAVFGEKDYQQLKTVTQMAKDLNIPVKVVPVPTRREKDGLAMSSRNRYLSGEERERAANIHAQLQAAATKIRKGMKPDAATKAAVEALTALGFKVDYIAARNAETLAQPTSKGEPLRLLAAAWLGKTRLIDNIAI